MTKPRTLTVFSQEKNRETVSSLERGTTDRVSDYAQKPALGRLLWIYALARLFTKVLKSFRYAFDGLRYAVNTQRNLKVHLGLTVVVIVIGIWVRLQADEWAVLALAIGLVLSLELANTALETLVDLASPEFDSLAKVCKDTAAAAVLIAAVTSVIVGFLILGPPLRERLVSLTSHGF